ncbi:MAG TPA: hypothetical protein VFX61_05575 [Micromonosporaceae bacterium]|nr:hypothetical protein [Micromonosporaceae bacterium]
MSLPPKEKGRSCEEAPPEGGRGYEVIGGRGGLRPGGVGLGQPAEVDPVFDEAAPGSHRRRAGERSPLRAASSGVTAVTAK